jgi:hypothetical protein
MKTKTAPCPIQQPPIGKNGSDELQARIDRLEHEKARYLSMFAQSGAPAIIVERDWG